MSMFDNLEIVGARPISRISFSGGPTDGECKKGIVIDWESDAGFGELVIYVESDIRGQIFEVETETLDKGDKVWVSAVLREFVKKLEVTE